ncbi:hypothetical protein Taro_020041 [Colocasia esculenta]|uniref:Uncharacterized protein n=1 Tax=Colocasia esculenta TaxID=4460 RepID=A0A843V7B6_COLES|nr:hypothetical protein [Colocasia esculenta]
MYWDSCAMLYTGDCSKELENSVVMSNDDNGKFDIEIHTKQKSSVRQWGRLLRRSPASGGSGGAGSTQGWRPERGCADDEMFFAFFRLIQLGLHECMVCVDCFLEKEPGFNQLPEKATD